jgi:AcrR family transcriptional regulator
VTEDTKTLVKEDRRKQILSAALTVFSRKGYGEATLPDIAGEAGVAVGTIYHYYKSKRDLLAALVQVYTYAMTEPLGEIFGQLAKEDERTSVRAIMEAGLDWGSDDLNGFLFVFTEVLRDPELGAPFAGPFLASVLELLERYVAERSSSGDFRQLDPKVAARALGGLILGFLVLRQLEGAYGSTKAKTLPELTAELADIFLEGVRNKGGTG